MRFPAWWDAEEDFFPWATVVDSEGEVWFPYCGREIEIDPYARVRIVQSFIEVR